MRTVHTFIQHTANLLLNLGVKQWQIGRQKVQRILYQQNRAHADHFAIVYTIASIFHQRDDGTQNPTIASPQEDLVKSIGATVAHEAVDSAGVITQQYHRRRSSMLLDLFGKADWIDAAHLRRHDDQFIFIRMHDPIQRFTGIGYTNHARSMIAE